MPFSRVRGRLVAGALGRLAGVGDNDDKGGNGESIIEECENIWK
jgi:hypothetical protein